MDAITNMKDQANKSVASNVSIIGGVRTTPIVPRSQIPSHVTNDPGPISPSSSQYFEVLYIGKIKVSHKRVPDTLIDDALDKLNLEKQKRERMHQEADELPVISPANSTNSLASPTTPDVPVVPNFGSSEVLKSDSNHNVPAVPPERNQVPLMRKRSGSAGSVLINKPESLSLAAAAVAHGGANSTSNGQDHNRTMLFHVGRSDLRLISPDRKQILLHKLFKDISVCLQGKKHTSHFTFVCREAGLEQPHYLGYLFKCQNPTVTEEVVTAISQALEAGKKEKPGVVVHCEHCPMVWYHKLCSELDPLTQGELQADRVKEVVSRRLEEFGEEERRIIETKLSGACLGGTLDVRDNLEVLMMLLRAHCEAKQARHVHDTPEARHEFINHYLGGGGGAIFQRAKRSLTNSFDQLLRRKGSRDDFSTILKERSLPANATLCKDEFDSHKKESSQDDSDPENDNSGSLINIFLKVGSSPTHPNGHKVPGTPDNSGSGEEDDKPSWRQAIFNAVVTPHKTMAETPAPKRDKEYYRSLWKKAINQQVLLIRMEKENARLTARQEEANVKRIKLDYDDLGVKENLDIWESVMARRGDNQILHQALKFGVPKAKRGDIWLHLVDVYCSKNPPFDSSVFPNYNTPYEDLLKQLTSCQHAILIDLGRTFPKHRYYASPLGQGQLALFNLLKAYSLLDPEVGYCQGLSFIAGVLLLHMNEVEAYRLLKHLMFVRGLRTNYLPNLSGLQVSLYQLSRLLHDQFPNLYRHFNKLEVAPTLYAAPWLLTIFASQFSLGYVTRVFDLMFAESPQVLFKFAIALLGLHKDQLLACDSFESLMNYMKDILPNLDGHAVDKIMKEVLSRDIGRQLDEYGVEYHVLQEEISSPRPETKKIKQLESEKRVQAEQIKALQDQLRLANGETAKLETQVRGLEVSVGILGDFVSSLVYDNKAPADIEIPSEVLKVLAQLNREQKKQQVGWGRVRSAPLRVLDENHKPAPFKSTISSPNLMPSAPSMGSRVSHFFGVHKDPEPPKDECQPQPQQQVPRGRKLTENDKKSLAKIRERKETEGPLPLESESVVVSFEGTTKLKTFKPVRHATAPNIPLKIIEHPSTDAISEKLRSTMDKVTHLFEHPDQLDDEGTLFNGH